MQAVETAVWLHTEPGDGVVLFTPVYFPFFPAVTSTGRRIVDCPLDPDGWRIDPERLASVIDPTTRAILLCNPHNPTGRVFDAEELAAIAEVAERHDLLVISDEIWGDLVHPGAKHVPIASLERRDRGAHGDHLGGEQGLQHRRAALRGRAHRACGSRRRAGGAAQAPARRGRLARGRGDARRVDGGGAVARAPSARTSPRSATILLRGSRQSCRRSASTFLRPPTWRGWTSGSSGSATRPRRRSSSAAGSRSRRVSTSGSRARGSRGSTSPRRREILDEIVDRIVRAVHG